MAQVENISGGSRTIVIDGVEDAEGILRSVQVQVVNAGLDADIVLNLQQSDDEILWHDLPEEPLTNGNFSNLLQSVSFNANYLSVKLDVLTATTGTITINNPEFP